MKRRIHSLIHCLTIFWIIISKITGFIGFDVSSDVEKRFFSSKDLELNFDSPKQRI